MGDAKGKNLRGVRYIPDKNISVPFWQRELNYDGDKDERVTGIEDTVGLDQMPNNESTAKTEISDIVAAQDAFLGVRYLYPFRLKQIDLPRELTALAVVPNSSLGTGASNHPVSQQDFQLTAGSGSLSPRSSVESSASLSYELQPTWRQVRRSNGPAIAVGFHAVGNLTEADILAAVGAADLLNAVVSSWPKFLEDEPSFILNGQQASVRAEADTATNISVDGNSTVRFVGLAYGDDYSVQVGLSSKVVQLPPCIYGTINITGTVGSITATATVKADTPALGTTVAGTLIPAVTNEPAARTKVVAATVSPTGLGSMVVPSIPPNGLYLYDWSIQDVGYGVWEIIAIVVEISDYV